VAHALILILNKRGEVELINKRGCRIMGYEAKEMLGRNWFENFIPEETMEERKEAFERSIKGCEKDEGAERYIKTKNGQPRLIRWSQSLLRDTAGSVIGLLKSGEDITERKVLQDMLASVEKEKRRQMIAAVLDAQERERLHIASELHDNVGQILTTCKLLLEGELKKENAPVSLGHTFQHLQNAINEIRTLAHKLNPAQLGEIGLVPALEELVGRINLAGKPVVSLVAERSVIGEVPPDISLALFRIVQEQLSNIFRHAAAHKVFIQLSRSNEAVELEITDDGKGFSQAKVTKGLGLKNMYNRVELFGGRVILQSAPGEGCTLSIYLPLGN
jgi:PAS domain S-box-containing protein